ncbi:MAG: ParM/StbA family protein [Ruminococcus flavefaciens]|nr:ParM/StbA family protein [Ruminococcus flavefaciens]
MLISIDHGNYAIKTVHHSFVSGLSEHTVKPPITDEVLEYEGKYWTLSGRRLNYMRDKTQDERYFILSLFAIAKELENTGYYQPVEKIQLAVGLPPEHYGVLRDKFSGYFQRNSIIKFVYKDKPYSIVIDRVMVFPQAYAAVVPQSSLIVNTLRVFVIDIGGYTTDVLLLKNGKPDLQFCRSLETGIITMNNEIIRKVGAVHDMRIEDEHISAVLQGRETILPKDVKNTICGATKMHAQDILNQLRELQVDLRSNPAIFIGGGSILLKPFLESSHLVAKADFVESPNANALGYELLGKKTLSLRPAQ